MATTRMVLSASMNDAWLPEGEATVHFYRKGERMDDGLPDRWLLILKTLGFTLLQVDSPFCTVPRENADGKWDWPHLDSLMHKCKKNGFDTAFFSRWHWPSREVENAPEFTGLACLEHGRSIPCWSIWNPKSLVWIDQCTAALHEKYQSTNGDNLDVLYMGVQGDYGETMYPQGSSPVVLEHDRGMTDYHLHPGYWCADPHAVRSFRNHLQGKYVSIEGLNAAWDSQYGGLGDVEFPSSSLYGQRRPWLDFVEWYCESMTDFASENATIARKYFVNNTIMVAMGGGNQCLQHGQDETSLIKRMKQFNVAIRSTAGCATHCTGADATEAFCRNYPYLKLISTACRHYGTPMWIEPPYPPGPSGPAMLWGLFEAISCGAAGCAHWSRTVIDNQAFFDRYRDFFTVEQPQTDTAILFPTTNHRIRAAHALPFQFIDLCARLRRAADYDVLDERLICDGALKDYALLILAEGTIFEKNTLAEIRNWVDRGGMFLLRNTGFPIETVEADQGYTEMFTGIRPASMLYPPTKVSYRAEAFLSHTASSQARYLSSARHLSGDVNVLATSAANGAVVWEKPLGCGRCITFAGDFNDQDAYLELVRDCIYNRHLLDSANPATESALPITDDWDDVFSALTANWLLILNFTDQQVTCRYADRDVNTEPWSLDRIARASP